MVKLRTLLTEIVINKPVPKFKTTKELYDYIKSYPDYKNKIIDEIVENSFLKNGTWDEAIEVWKRENKPKLNIWANDYPDFVHITIKDEEDNSLYLSMHNIFNTENNINEPIKLGNNEIYYTII